MINISQNGNYKLEEIQGHIKKICIKANSPLHSVNLTFITTEGEIIYKTSIENNILVLYPFNHVEVQDKVVEFYSYGDIGIIVDGLIDGQVIDKISIFYA